MQIFFKINVKKILLNTGMVTPFFYPFQFNINNTFECERERMWRGMGEREKKEGYMSI